ncbi:MAG: phosphoribosylamine--glycine ligase [Chloroflexi bacterium]|nr:phosphoribosylamine--glycine ligase [Chloroflexota bacterium]MDA1148052.1 phosphoribosylamine--glycine ligase [Chloroflexota bacterium]MQC82580.1 phosphoribosylamine--glycine ligase [Chloroflexota bacterium]MQC83191.1 phosphoribosylamine--glycine ligase [Chloroflexota bacterium]PKB56569.1 MAG: phosphoribosylamine--glycine ligase [SAR202 cluster bacterium Casp-Chloro-G1]
MNVLLLGSGGREHAIAWKLAQSPRLSKLWIAPGNAGMQQLGELVSDVTVMDFDAVLGLAERVSADLVIVGPDDPISAGLADRLAEAGFKVFAPSAAAAQIEGSKAFANQLMAEAGIATAISQSFDDPETAKRYVRECGYQVVIKPDGLTAGKGVTVCDDIAEAEAAIDQVMVERLFGDAGTRIVVEERMYGRETSAHAFSDGTTVRHMPFSCDHKPVFDGNVGPNTGGMGVYSPPGWLDEEIAERIRLDVTERAIAALAAAGRPFAGVLYPGLMVTPAGPKVVEFNARFGDPETEILLTKLRSDLLEICLAVAERRLADVEVEWDDVATVGVMMASGGYPGSYETGKPISGLDRVDADVQVFVAGAREEGGQLVTAGGRVLCVVARGTTIEEARVRAYENVARISFEGAHYRTDIGLTADQPLQVGVR